MAETPVAERFAREMFPGADFGKVNEVFANPLRELGRLGMENSESLMTALVATRGEAENAPLAAIKFLIERAGDPLRLLHVVLSLPLKNGGR